MILIIGAGLSGLLTAYRLKNEGIPFKILEARNRVGGRINTVYGVNQTPIEMGATWFTSQHPHLKALLEELGTDYYEQHMDRTVFYEAHASSRTQRVQIPSQAPSYRISGGTSNLIDLLLQKLDKKDILLNQLVKEIKIQNNFVHVYAKEVFKGDTAVLAIPPKLWTKKISFNPHLPSDLKTIGSQTHTWMEDSIKVALTYNQPFWLQDKIPGTLFSAVGPITELYDHCNHQRSKYALCGFIDSSFKNLTYAERKTKVIHQIKGAFGEKAGTFVDYEECVWSKEQHTFEASETFLFPHQNNGNPIFSNGFFNDKLLISSAESASEFPGYMEGAVVSANTTIEKIIQTRKLNK